MNNPFWAPDMGTLFLSAFVFLAALIYIVFAIE